MPYYNNRDVIKRSIDSIICQEYNQFELIIINDGSKEEITDIIDNYNDNRIIYFSQENMGVSGARNRGIKESKYNWICFLDSDDTWEPDHLKEMKRLIKKYESIKFFATGYKRIGNTTFISSDCLPSWYPDDFISNNLLEEVIRFGELIHTNSVCFSKDLISACGLFKEGVSIGEDTDLWYRIAMKNPIVISKRITSVYHRDASYLTKESSANIEWPFMYRNNLMEDVSIPIENKVSMNIIVKRAQLSSCKRLIEKNEIQKAAKLFNDIQSNVPRCLRKSKMEVKILLKLPSRIACNITRFIYRRQQKLY